MREWGNTGGRKQGAGRPKGPETRVIRLPVPLADLARRLAQHGIRAGDNKAFLDVEPRTRQSMPLVEDRTTWSESNQRPAER